MDWRSMGTVLLIGAGAMMALPVQATQTSAACSPIVTETTGNVVINNNCPLKISPEQLRKIVEAVRASASPNPALMKEYRQLSNQLGVTDSALNNFFRIIGQQAGPLDDLDANLRKVAERHLTLLADAKRLTAAAPENKALIEEAQSAIRNGDYDRAEKLLAEAESDDIAAAHRAQDESERRLLSAAEIRAQRGHVQMAQFHYAAGAAHFAAAADLVPPGHPLVRALDLNDAGEAWYYAGRYELAVAAHKEALRLREQNLAPDHSDIASSINNMAIAYEALGRLDDAIPLLQRALAIDETKLGPDHPSVAIRLSNLGRVYRDQGRLDEAIPLLKRALAIDEDKLGSYHPRVAIRLSNLAKAYQDQGRLDDAIRLLQRARAIDEAKLGASQNRTLPQKLNGAQKAQGLPVPPPSPGRNDHYPGIGDTATAELVTIFGKTAGLAGLGMAMVIIIFRMAINQKLLALLSKAQVTAVIVLALTLSSTIGLAGIFAWYEAGQKDAPQLRTAGPGSPIVQGTGGNVSLSITAPAAASAESSGKAGAADGVARIETHGGQSPIVTDTKGGVTITIGDAAKAKQP